MNPPALCRLRRRQRQRRAGQVRTHQFYCGKHRKTVEHHMLAGHAKLVNELLAHDVGGHATACGMQHHPLRFHIGFFMGSKTDDVLNAKPSRRRRKPLKERIVTIEHRIAASLDAAERFQPWHQQFLLPKQNCLHAPEPHW